MNINREKKCFFSEFYVNYYDSSIEHVFLPCSVTLKWSSCSFTACFPSRTSCPFLLQLACYSKSHQRAFIWEKEQWMSLVEGGRAKRWHHARRSLASQEQTPLSLPLGKTFMPSGTSQGGFTNRLSASLSRYFNTPTFSLMQENKPTCSPLQT